LNFWKHTESPTNGNNGKNEKSLCRLPKRFMRFPIALSMSKGELNTSLQRDGYRFAPPILQFELLGAADPGGIWWLAER
jgi:hypothetical protein